MCKNKMCKHSLPIHTTNFKKILGKGLVLVTKDNRVHNLNLKLCVVRVFLHCASYS